MELCLIVLSPTSITNGHSVKKNVGVVTPESHNYMYLVKEWKKGSGTRLGKAKVQSLKDIRTSIIPSWNSLRDGSKYKWWLSSIKCDLNRGTSIDTSSVSVCLGCWKHTHEKKKKDKNTLTKLLCYELSGWDTTKVGNPYLS